MAIILTFSFGFYGLAKKQASAGAIEGMAVESATVAPLALIAIAVLGFQGQATVTHEGPGYLTLVLLTGPITAVPLLLFGAAATRVSMTTLGLLNYIAPIMQFVVGVVVFHEQMTPMRWAGFGLVWIALVIFTVNGLRTHAADDRTASRDNRLRSVIIQPLFATEGYLSLAEFT